MSNRFIFLILNLDFMHLKISFLANHWFLIIPKHDHNKIIGQWSKLFFFKNLNNHCWNSLGKHRPFDQYDEQTQLKLLQVQQFRLGYQLHLRWQLILYRQGFRCLNQGCFLNFWFFHIVFSSFRCILILKHHFLHKIDIFWEILFRWGFELRHGVICN